MHERLRAFVASSVRRAAQLPPAEVLASQVAELPPAVALDLEGFSVIAEVKFRAPSQAADFAPPDVADAVRRARSYVRGGACAISVLTEPDYFLGSMRHLSAVADAVPVPVMRKDFLVSPAQVFEARLHGASGVLVVLRCTSDPGALIDAAAQAGMFVLVEAFDAEDLDLLDALLPLDDRVLVGVNARDLDTLGVDGARHERLFARLPAGLRTVAESGVHTPEHAAHAATLGYNLALVGSALMAHDDPAALLGELLAAANGARLS